MSVENRNSTSEEELQIDRWVAQWLSARKVRLARRVRILAQITEFTSALIDLGKSMDPSFLILLAMDQIAE